jgi:hypothetical protein
MSQKTDKIKLCLDKQGVEEVLYHPEITVEGRKHFRLMTGL